MMKKVLLVMLVLIVAGIFFARKTSSTVRVERTVMAPIAAVWQAWTETESIKKWWSPKDFTAPIIQNDFQVGGKFLFSMRSPKGEMFWNTGKYVEIVPQEKILSMMAFSDENGNPVLGKDAPVPGVWPDEITVLVEFRNAGNGGTVISISEIGIPLIMKLMAKMGWEQQLDKFEALLK